MGIASWTIGAGAVWWQSRSVLNSKRHPLFAVVYAVGLCTIAGLIFMELRREQRREKLLEEMRSRGAFLERDLSPHGVMGGREFTVDDTFSSDTLDKLRSAFPESRIIQRDAPVEAIHPVLGENWR